MLDITGARTQPPMRSHWKLRPGPQSYLLCNSKQLSKRYKRGKQHKQHSSHRDTSNREWAQTVKGHGPVTDAVQSGKGGSRLQQRCRGTQGYLPHLNHATSCPSILTAPPLRPLVHAPPLQGARHTTTPHPEPLSEHMVRRVSGAVECKADLTSTTSPRVPPPSLGQR